MAYDLVSFDLDGTLVDSASEIAEAANRALATHGIERRPPGEITHLIGNGTRELMVQLLARVFHERPALAERVRVETVLASFDEHYAATVGSSGLPYGGAREALSDLKVAGVTLVCVTNKELRHARALLRATRLLSFFELVVGGDSLQHKKPHRAVLEHVMQRFGSHRSRTAHVGDSWLDVEAARNAGVQAWAVPYGYNAGQPIDDARPQRVFRSLADVAAHVLAARRAEPAGAPR